MQPFPIEIRHVNPMPILSPCPMPASMYVAPCHLCASRLTPLLCMMVWMRASAPALSIPSTSDFNANHLHHCVAAFAR